MTPTFETVEQFKDWWVKAGMPLRPPFKNAVFTTDISYALVLFRSGQYQVELYITKANTQAPWHQHPGVDSFFIYLAGNIEFGEPDGTFKDLQAFQKPRADGCHALLGQTASVKDGGRHTLRVFDEGGAFLSFEKWHESEPVSVAVQWRGDPVGVEHAQLLERECV